MSRTRNVTYRGLFITKEHTKGCFINGAYFNPRGEFFGRVYALLIYHIICKIGGTEQDFKDGNKIVREIAIEEVRRGFSIFNPMRYFSEAIAWRNWVVLSGRVGRESFNFNDAPRPMFITVLDYEALRPQ